MDCPSCGHVNRERARALAQEGLARARALGHVPGEIHAHLAVARVLLGSAGTAAREQIEAALARAPSWRARRARRPTSRWYTSSSPSWRDRAAIRRGTSESSVRRTACSARSARAAMQSAWRPSWRCRRARRRRCDAGCRRHARAQHGARLMVRFPSVYCRQAALLQRRLSPGSRVRHAFVRRGFVSGWTAFNRRDFELKLVPSRPMSSSSSTPACRRLTSAARPAVSRACSNSPANLSSAQLSSAAAGVVAAARARVTRARALHHAPALAACGA